MYTKFQLNQVIWFWDTKQRDIWPLTLISIAKMASYQLGVIIWYDRLITVYVHTKLQLDRISGSWNSKQRDVWTLTFICVAKMASYRIGVHSAHHNMTFIQNYSSKGSVDLEIQNKGIFELWPSFAYPRWPHINLALLWNIIS